MTFLFHKSRYHARFARDDADLRACQQLRHQCFFNAPGRDRDRFDPLCRHVMVLDPCDRVVATARLLVMPDGRAAGNSYAAQHYDMKGLLHLRAPLLELGRFCIARDVIDADVLRVVWAMLTQTVDQCGVAMVFGCTSFQGTNPAAYGAVFARLRARHLGPDPLRPVCRQGCAVRFADVPDSGREPMPPLLRTYLAMGGWVGDHAVVDHTMNTLHVFTCLDVGSVPPKRAASLRALAKDVGLS